MPGQSCIPLAMHLRAGGAYRGETLEEIVEEAVGRLDGAAPLLRVLSVAAIPRGVAESFPAWGEVRALWNG